MRYRTLGRTGLVVSELGFGGAPAGLRNYLERWEPTDPAAVEQQLAALVQAVELGVTYFDTAPGYGEGLGEEMYGRALEPYRERIVLASKVQVATAAEVWRSVEASLKRLRTDRLDLLQFHGGWYSDDAAEQILAPGGALEGMEQVRAAGLTRFLGFTTEGVTGGASRLVATGAFDVMQICYNLIFQHPYEPSRRGGILYEAEAQGMGIVTMRTLTSGIFQKWLHHVFQEVDGLAQERLAAALLSFVLSNRLVSSALVGMRSPDEVERNCAAADDERWRMDLEVLHTRYV